MSVHSRQIFAVNASNGALLVHDGSLLDRETRSIYYANLQAKDGGDLVGTTVLEITVLDANDMVPVVIGSYFISVEEGQNVSTQIQVRAHRGGGVDRAQRRGCPRGARQPRSKR